MTIAATTSLESAAARTWDAVVVGAGPAGAMAAHELTRRGLAVLLVDRAAFPRWKVCGCCLNRHALAALHGAGMGQLVGSAGAVSLERLHLASAGRSARVPLAGGVSLSRECFDAALVSAAIEAGAAFLPQTRASLAASVVAGGWRTVELRQEHRIEEVTTRVVLAADGLGGQFAARAGEVATAAGARIGAGAIAVDAPAFYEPGVIFMACGRHGYLGLVRLEDGRLDLAAAFDAAGVRARGGPARAAAALLAEAGWPAVEGHGWRGTPALTRRAQRVAGERLFLLGDAAGYVEPFTGEGMSWALTAARAVAPLVQRAARDWHPGLVAQWAMTYRRLLGRRQLVCRAVAAVLRSPPLIRTTIHLLSLAPVLAAPLASPGELMDASTLFGMLDREIWLVTAAAGPRRGGLIATFVNPATIVPDLPRVLVGLARQHHTWELVEASNAFALHLLGEQQIDWVWRFGLESGRGRDKLDGLPWRTMTTGSPVLEGVIGWLDCRVEARLDSGDRTVYLAGVVQSGVMQSAPPLTMRRLVQLAPSDRLAEMKRQLQHDSAIDAEAIRRWREQKF